jgi:hypothetical protein
VLQILRLKRAVLASRIYLPSWGRVDPVDQSDFIRAIHVGFLRLFLS